MTTPPFIYAITVSRDAVLAWVEQGRLPNPKRFAPERVPQLDRYMPARWPKLFGELCRRPGLTAENKRQLLRRVAGPGTPRMVKNGSGREWTACNECYSIAGA
jgi:hypothetical protein